MHVNTAPIKLGLRHRWGISGAREKEEVEESGVFGI